MSHVEPAETLWGPVSIDMRPTCELHLTCANPAEFLVASSSKRGAEGSVAWAPACSECLDGWNDSGDWPAPMIRLGENVVAPGKWSMK